MDNSNSQFNSKFYGNRKAFSFVLIYMLSSKLTKFEGFFVGVTFAYKLAGGTCIDKWSSSFWKQHSCIRMSAEQSLCFSLLWMFSTPISDCTEKNVLQWSITRSNERSIGIFTPLCTVRYVREHTEFEGLLPGLKLGAISNSVCRKKNAINTNDFLLKVDDFSLPPPSRSERTHQADLEILDILSEFPMSIANIFTVTYMYMSATLKHFCESQSQHLQMNVLLVIRGQANGAGTYNPRWVPPLSFRGPSAFLNGRDGTCVTWKSWAFPLGTACSIFHLLECLSAWKEHIGQDK